MIAIQDRYDITAYVENAMKNILHSINFDHKVKEPGHSFHGVFEDILVNQLLTINGFEEPSQTRSLEDVSYKGNLINIKFGYKKKR